MIPAYILYNASVIALLINQTIRRATEAKKRNTNDDSCGVYRALQSLAREKMYGENFVDLTLSTSSFVTRLHSCA